MYFIINFAVNYSVIWKEKHRACIPIGEGIIDVYLKRIYLFYLSTLSPKHNHN